MFSHFSCHSRLYATLLFLPFFFVHTAFAGDDKAKTPWVLTEASLLQAIKEENPEQLRIKAMRDQAEYDSFVVQQDYQARWLSRLAHQNSEEKALASFIPTFGPTYRISTGLAKRLPVGVDLQGEFFIDQQSTSDRFIDAATRTGVLLSASVDLWRNFLGRVDKAKLQSKDLQFKKQALQAQISSRAFELDLRKTFWSLVANNEKIRVSEELLKSSRFQLKEGLVRSKRHIGDKQEIARYKAQVASREAALLSLEYSRDLLIQALKTQLPKLATANIVLGDYDRSQAVVEVLTCVSQIESSKGIPWQTTKWDEALAFIEQDFAEKQRQTARYAGPELKFSSQLQMSGVEKGVDDSFADFSDSGELGYNLALTLDVPLGRTRAKARKTQIARDAAEFAAEKQRIEARVQATHTQVVSLVRVLRQSVEKLEETNRNFRDSIQEMNKKFRQARVTVNEVVQDQDALLQSMLTEIDSNLQVIHTLLDYFKVFHDSPCKINNLKVS